MNKAGEGHGCVGLQEGDVVVHCAVIEVLMDDD